MKPFVVTYVSARKVSDFPTEYLDLLGPPGRRPENLNFALMLIDADGKRIKMLSPSIRPPTFRFDPELQGKDFQRQLEEFLKDVRIPKPNAVAGARGLRLPDVDGEEPLRGVRVYLTFGRNRLNHYRTPTVEAVRLTPTLRAAIQRPDRAIDVAVKDLRPILEQLYPPAIMDGYGGFESIDGEFRLRPVETTGPNRTAILEGTARFALDNKSRIRYSGKMSWVIDYTGDDRAAVRIRGTFESVVPKHDPRGAVVEEIEMRAAIESLTK